MGTNMGRKQQRQVCQWAAPDQRGLGTHFDERPHRAQRLQHSRLEPFCVDFHDCYPLSREHAAAQQATELEGEHRCRTRLVEPGMRPLESTVRPAAACCSRGRHGITGPHWDGHWEPVLAVRHVTVEEKR